MMLLSQFIPDIRRPALFFSVRPGLTAFLLFAVSISTLPTQVMALEGILIDEVVEQEVGVEEAAQEQAINLGFIVPDDNFDQWVFNLNGTIDKGGVKTRQKLRDLADSRIEELDRLCSLTEPQKQKLRLAAHGDIVRLFDQVELVRAKFSKVRNDQNKFNQIFQDVQPLQTAINSEQFGTDSFFYKTVAKTLTPEQVRRFEDSQLDRRRFQYRAAIAIVVAQLENSVPLLEKQRHDLIELTLRETPIPRRFGQYNHQMVLAQMSEIPKAELEKILDPVQARIIHEQLGQIRGMKRWLIQQGILDADSPRKNNDVDD